MTGTVSVDEARRLIIEAVAPLPAETLGLDEAAGRVLAETVRAQIDQPPFDASAMDGYAVRLSDCAVGARLRVIGEASAGGRFRGEVAAGTAIRIFTGAPVPVGADHVLIQEEAERSGGAIAIKAAQAGAANIRRAGIDFERGAVLGEAGDRLTGARLALIAAGNVTSLSVAQRPRVALIANGDELVLPGATLGADQIVCSIPAGLGPMIHSWGGAPRFLGIARDDPADIAALIDRARGFDLVVPIGGASVGDRDFMRAAFEAAGLAPIFEKVSLRPGKPTWFGRLGASFVLGLPGNPASALVSARLFLKPAIKQMLWRSGDEQVVMARTLALLGANGARETFLRARFSGDDDGVTCVTAFADQDSSLLRVLAHSDALIRRPANAPQCSAGALVPCLRI
ncbi:MAG: gephyrin-like molybdotransferase Glp [Parvularculaceae bacterium]